MRKPSRMAPYASTIDAAPPASTVSRQSSVTSPLPRLSRLPRLLPTAAVGRAGCQLSRSAKVSGGTAASKRSWYCSSPYYYCRA